MGKRNMKVSEALKIVIELARKNAIDAQQIEAIAIVEDMAVNEFDDDHD
jgi:hypothetical protein